MYEENRNGFLSIMNFKEIQFMEQREKSWQSQFMTTKSSIHLINFAFCTLHFAFRILQTVPFVFSWGVMRHPTPPQGACTKSLRLLPSSRSASLFCVVAKIASPLSKKSSSTISGKPPHKMRCLPSSRRHVYRKRPFFSKKVRKRSVWGSINIRLTYPLKALLA